MNNAVHKSWWRNHNVQCFASLLVIVYLFALTSWKYNHAHAGEKSPLISQPSAQSSRLANEVKTGMHINSFQAASFQTGNFVIDAVVWFQFPSCSEDISTIREFSFLDGKIISCSKPLIIVENGNTLVSYHVVAQLSPTLNYNSFPLNNHHLYITLENRSVNSNEMLLTSHKENLTFSQDGSIDLWDLSVKGVESGAISHEITNTSGLSLEYPTVVYCIECVRNSTRPLITLYLCLFLIFFSIFYSLLSPFDNTDFRVGVGITGVSGLVLLRLIISTMTPTTDVITLIDRLYFFLVVLSVIILFLNVYIFSHYKKFMHYDYDESQTKKTILNLLYANDIMFAIILGLVVVGVTWFTLI